MEASLCRQRPSYAARQRLSQALLSVAAGLAAKHWSTNSKGDDGGDDCDGNATGVDHDRSNDMTDAGDSMLEEAAGMSAAIASVRKACHAADAAVDAALGMAFPIPLSTIMATIVVADAAPGGGSQARVGAVTGTVAVAGSAVAVVAGANADCSNEVAEDAHGGSGEAGAGAGAAWWPNGDCKTAVAGDVSGDGGESPPASPAWRLTLAEAEATEAEAVAAATSTAAAKAAAAAAATANGGEDNTFSEPEPAPPGKAWQKFRDTSFNIYCTLVSWHPIASYGILCNLLASYGILWHPVASYGILCHPMTWRAMSARPSRPGVPQRRRPGLWVSTHPRGNPARCRPRPAVRSILITPPPPA